jgi:hypothetical protein
MSRPKLYGILSIYREFVPDFASLTEDLRKLLSDDTLPWLPEHTRLVKLTAERILGAVEMLNFDAG